MLLAPSAPSLIGSLWETVNNQRSELRRVCGCNGDKNWSFSDRRSRASLRRRLSSRGRRCVAASCGSRRASSAGGARSWIWWRRRRRSADTGMASDLGEDQTITRFPWRQALRRLLRCVCVVVITGVRQHVSLQRARPREHSGAEGAGQLLHGVGVSVLLSFGLIRRLRLLLSSALLLLPSCCFVTVCSQKEFEFNKGKSYL